MIKVECPKCKSPIFAPDKSDSYHWESESSTYGCAEVGCPECGATLNAKVSKLKADAAKPGASAHDTGLWVAAIVLIIAILNAAIACCIGNPMDSAVILTISAGIVVLDLMSIFSIVEIDLDLDDDYRIEHTYIGGMIIALVIAILVISDIFMISNHDMIMASIPLFITAPFILFWAAHQKRPSGISYFSGLGLAGVICIGMTIVSMLVCAAMNNFEILASLVHTRSLA